MAIMTASAEPNKTFMGFHQLSEDGSGVEIIYSNGTHIADGFYWVKMGKPGADGTRPHESHFNGPFPTSEGAYLSAIGD